MNKEPRIILWDVETSLELVAIFQLAHNDWINPESIVQERHLISAAWKELGEDKVHAVAITDDPKSFNKDPHDDYIVCKKLHEVLSSADAIVHHNGNRFDIKYVETRLLKHGFSPLPPIPMIDTYQVAKSRFLFNSNKLDYLGKFLGLGKKIETTPGLWMKALRGDAAAIKAMVVYNKQDVLLLEKVFLKLRPFIQNHINRQLFGLSGCPRCGSKKIQRRGVHRAITRVYQRLQCMSCGGWFKELKPSASATPGRLL